MYLISTLSCMIAFAAASAVTNLTATTLPAFVKEHDLSLIAFVVPWCQFCHELYPEYEAAADMLGVDSWAFGRIDCDVDKELCTQYKVPIYPTIRIFHGEEHSIYNGKRRADDMVAFMKRHSQPIVTRLETAQEVAEFSTRDKVTVIGYFDDSDESSQEVFTTLAGTLRDEYLFGFTTDGAFSVTETVQKPAIVIFKTFDEGKNVFEEAFELEKAMDFVIDAATPHIQEIGVDLNHARSTNLPMAVIFATDLEQRKQLVDDLRPLAESTKEEVFWIIVDPDKYPEYSARVALTPGEWPAFGIDDTERNDFKFAYPKRGSVAALNAATIQQVVEDFLTGKLESSIKSEPVPKQQDGPVTVVVANSYEEEVNNGDKDVLMLFYSPTCKHCKKLEPDYESLAKLMSPLSDNIKVAKIDATSNDVWPRVSAYPTIKLFTFNNRDLPIGYEGDRSVADMVEFVRANASQETIRALDDLVELRNVKHSHDEL